MLKSGAAAIIFRIFTAVLALAGAAFAVIIFRHAAIGAPLSFYPSEFFYSAAAKYKSIISASGNKYPTFARDIPGEMEDKPSIDASAAKSVNLPASVYIKVPFTPQAPFLNWSDPYTEACEEASAVMAMAWARGEDLTPLSADAGILGAIAYENFYFGYNHDTALRETAKIFTRYYGYKKIREAYGINLDDIKFELASGNIVIVPASGAMLANPYYASPPPYHMLVISGYDDISKEFITNDPGTRRGRGYRYAYDILWNAIHDWTGDEATLLEGRKGMIVVEPRGLNLNY